MPTLPTLCISEKSSIDTEIQESVRRCDPLRLLIFKKMLHASPNITFIHMSSNSGRFSLNLAEWFLVAYNAFKVLNRSVQKYMPFLETTNSSLRSQLLCEHPRNLRTIFGGFRNCTLLRGQQSTLVVNK